MKRIIDLEPKQHNKFNSYLIRAFQFIYKVYTKFMEDAGMARAGSLAFNTLLAAIPFVALIISLLNAFGAFDTLETQIIDFIVKLLIPTRQNDALEIINQFLENSTTLGVVGLIFFSITSIMLLNTITINLNAVWGSVSKNNFINKFTTYAAVIIFGTILLAASTTMSSRLSLFILDDIPFLKFLLQKFAPFIFDFFVIMLLIGLVPSGKIKLKYLFAVSAIGAIFWELLKYTFFNVSSSFIRMSVIYGTIAIIPIFLFWVYIIWIIIIVTMEIAWVLQHKNKAWHSNTYYNMLPGEKFAFSFSVFIKVAEAFNSGETPPTSEYLSSIFSTSVADINNVLDFFANNNFVIKTGEDGQSWVPATSLNRIKTENVLNAIIGKYDTQCADSATAFFQIEAFNKEGLKSVKGTTIEELLQKNNPV
ncbi:MAG: YihY family inner membrane protein [Spirochaetales bacterium]|nr:YihY family inner membrane protein [Spirochaetales bacterium]